MKKNKILHILCIILFIAISIATIIASEIYYYDNNKLANNLNKNTIVIKNNKISSKNEGKVVLVNGNLEYDNQILNDDLYDINIKTPKLLRLVEIYQWNRYKEKDENGKIRYVYYKMWSSELIKSKKFNGHDNPKTKKHGTKYYFADDIKIGEFFLSKSQRKMLSTNKQIKFKKNMKLENNYKIYKNYIINSSNPKKPKVGDIRISYHYNDVKKVTVLAVQHNKSFSSNKTKQKPNVLKEDDIELNEITDSYRKGSKFSLWFVRIICAIIIIINIKQINIKIKNN